LAGGGDLSADRTLALNESTGVKTSGSSLAVDFATGIKTSGNTLVLDIATGLTTSGNSIILANPSASTIGGIRSLAAVASNWINAISTSGVPSATQPNFTDLAGTISTGQCPTCVTSTSGGAITATSPIAVTAGAKVSISVDNNFTTSAGNLAIAAISSGNLIANGSASSVEPVSTTLSFLLDRVFGTGQGATITRGASVWSASPTPVLGLAGTSTGTLGLSGISAGVATLASNASAANVTITTPISTGTIALINVTDQLLSGGANVTANSLGTKSSGTFTVDCGLSPLQYLTNGGAFTLASPANDGSCIVLSTNNASAGTISFSGFSVGSNTGDAFTNTNGQKFSIQVWRINGVSRYLVSAHQ
jgi:hypothetical protein